MSVCLCISNVCGNGNVITVAKKKKKRRRRRGGEEGRSKGWRMAKEGRGKILLSLYCHKNYFSCKKTFLLTFFFQDQLILNHMPTSLLSPSFSLSSSPSSPSSSPPSSSLSQQRRQGKNRRKKVQDLK